MATEVEIIVSNILSLAIENKRLFDTTKKIEYREKEQRLRRIAENIKLLNLDSPTSSISTLNDLTDVTISAPANGQVLTYNSTTSQWENQSPGGGGGGDMTKAVYDPDNDGVVDAAETTQIIVRNSTGSTLTKGTVVYLSGATGNRPNALRSQANSEATSSKTIGFVVADISNNSDGYVAVSGTLHDLDTSAFADGVALWLSPSVAGGWTTTVPVEPNHSVFLGYVARSHPTQGRVVILIQNGYELNELHDVYAPTPSNGDLLQWDSTNAYWKNVPVATVVPTPTLNAVTTAGNTTTNAITVGGVTVSNGVISATKTTSGSVISITPASSDNAIEIFNNGYIKWNNAAISYLRQFSTSFSILDSTYTSKVLFHWGGSASYINTGGNLLINTTTDAGYKLDVNGTIRSNNQAYFGEDKTFTSSQYYYLINASADGLVVFNNTTTGVNQPTGYLTGELYLDGSFPFNNHRNINNMVTCRNTSTSNILRAFYASARTNNSGAANTVTGFLGGVNIEGSGNVTNAIGLEVEILSQTNSKTITNLYGLKIQPLINSVGTITNTYGIYIDSLTAGTQTNAAYGIYQSGTNKNYFGGSVGIGTTTPNAGLEVANAQNSTLRLTRDSNTANYLQLQGGSAGGIYNINTSGTQDHIFQTAGTEVVRIKSGGNVLIGTSTDSGYKLDVNGTARVVNTLNLDSNLTFGANNIVINSTAVFGRLSIYGNASSASAISIGYLSTASNNSSVSIGYNSQNSGDRAVTIGADTSSSATNSVTIGRGSVGVANSFVSGSNLGTITDVYFGSGARHAISNTAGVDYIINGSGASANFNIAGGNIIIAGGKGTGTGTPGDVIFATSSLLGSSITLQTLTNRVWIKGDSGNVGIGTSSPTDKLHIVDNTNGNKFGRITAGGTDASAAWVAQNDQVDNVVYRVFGSAVTGSQMGISLARSASLMANLGGSGKFLIGTYSSTDFVMGTGNQERMRLVDSTGNFLVGTTTDLGNRLEVSGTVSATGYKINGTPGWSGIINIPTMPPISIFVDNGIITNVI